MPANSGEVKLRRACAKCGHVTQMAVGFSFNDIGDLTSLSWKGKQCVGCKALLRSPTIDEIKRTLASDYDACQPITN